MKLKNKLDGMQVDAVLRHVAGLLLLFLPAMVAADENTSAQAQRLINEMSRAGRHLNYDGIFVYRHGSRMETMRIIHKADASKEQERLVSLTGFAREVIRNDDLVICYFPDNQAVMVEKSRPNKLLSTQLPDPIEKIAGYYTFAVTGKDRVAGRSTLIVNITPRDDFRYGYQLWIDEETRFMLKSELKDDSGWPVEQILFTNITFVPDIPQDLLKPALSTKGYTWHNNSAAGAVVVPDKSAWNVTALPGGFLLSSHESQEAVENSSPLEYMIYSDGLAMVSVFVEAVDMLSRPEARPTKIGGVNAFATYVNGYQITAVGEVPLKTVKMMANSVIQTR